MKFFLASLILIILCLSLSAQDGYAMQSQPDSLVPKENSLDTDIKNIDVLTSLNLRDSLVAELISYGETFLGCPYRYAGKTKQGFDCSGYVSTMFAHIGVKLSPSSVGMSGSGRVVADSIIRPGDILFFINTQRRRNGIGHVGYVIENKDNEIVFLHSACNGGVKYEKLSNPYYKRHYFKAERIPIFDVD